VGDYPGTTTHHYAAMKAYNCLIVEDSEPTALVLKNHLNELSIVNSISHCSTVAEATQLLISQSFDLIFLDVELNEDSGLELLKMIDNLPPVVVTSSHTKYAFECFDLNVADYIQKPVTKSRLLRSISRAIGVGIGKDSVVSNDAIFLKVSRRLQKFTFDNIDFIEAYGIYSKVHSQQKFEVVNDSLAVIEKRLPAHLFRRVHKSYIVNLNQITSYNQNNFFIQDTKIPIGASYRDTIPNIYDTLDDR
jgi:two-component system, LytTR family, response regulator LytT